MAHFDEYADNYNQILQDNLSCWGNYEYFAEYKIKLIQKNIKTSPNNILEYGCGIGQNFKFLSKHFPDAELYGCDISETSLKLAAKTNPSVTLFSHDDNKIKQQFDLIFVANVFHHISPESRLNSLVVIFNYLRNAGDLFIFEHNPYNPVTRHLVNTCSYDSDAILLKPGELQSLVIEAGFTVKAKRYTLFFPPFLKTLNFIENVLGSIPFGGQYLIHAEKK